MLKKLKYPQGPHGPPSNVKVLPKGREEPGQGSCSAYTVLDLQPNPTPHPSGKVLVVAPALKDVRETFLEVLKATIGCDAIADLNDKGNAKAVSVTKSLNLTPRRHPHPLNSTPSHSHRLTLSHVLLYHLRIRSDTLDR